ncbi:hypothetical protein KA005_57330, partial [bacterium]|nr:hypothetical protein [bacterium]
DLPGVCSRIMTSVRGDKKLNWLYEATKSTSEIDIEQLISLLEELNLERYRKAADKLRKFYYADILRHLTKTRVFKTPKLSMSLFELHQNEELRNIEPLTGIISLNHDYLLETACQKIFKGVNLGVAFTSDIFDLNKEAPPIIKLFGSFNWKSGERIQIFKCERSKPPDRELLWIPPTIAKEARSYPFNKLMGIAYELLMLKCDILRVVGCSLNQNDWEVISLLFKTQCIRGDGCFDIELIQSRESGEDTKERLGYLRNVKTIAELEGSFTDYFDQEQEPDNPYEDWLRKTIDEKRISEGTLGKNLKELYY